jgi:hypothetical protein
MLLAVMPDFAAGQTPAAPPAVEASAAIAARMHWIHFNMVSGRVVATSNLTVQRMLVQSPGRRSRRRESLSIEINGGVCGMQYDAVAADEQLRISLSGGNQLAIRRTRPGEQYALEFQQRPDKPLALRVDRSGDKKSVQADGFWQMYLVEPELVRVHLVPLLELLHPSWQLAATGAEIEDALVRTQQAPAREPPDRKAWQRLVDALGSPKFAERETAQRELYRAGQAVVPYLQGLDRNRLDAEQTARIAAVIESLSVDYEDRVERVAGWLAGDERVWLALLARDDPARRRIAAEQLGRLQGEPIAFDPDGPAETRRQQIEQLRARMQLAEQGDAPKP